MVKNYKYLFRDKIDHLRKLGDLIACIVFYY